MPARAIPEQHRGARPSRHQAPRLSQPLGFRCFASAARTIEGIETIHMIRKAQVRWLSKEDVVVGQVRFVTELFGISIAA
jgi:hypothetical protein